MNAGKRAPALDPSALDLGYLALFVGMRINELVLERLHAAGFPELRHSHGYVFQHLLGGPRTVSELGELLEVTQQAASKAVAELAALGYVQDAADPDRRTRRVKLSARGRAAIAKARALRKREERRLVARHGAQPIARARALLAAVLEDLGGAESVRTRRIRAPR